jgi:phosphoribosylformylglycinamidine synthase subunit PurS
MWLAEVYVTLKPSVRDPQGMATQSGLHNLGFENVKNVRVGKFIEVTIDEADREAAERQVREMCSKLLSNPVIEEFRFDLIDR